jgi:hypothetical protein
MKVRYTPSYEPIDDGSYVARLNFIIDMGTQETNFGEKPQVSLGFELLDCETSSGVPPVVSRTFTVSLHEKSTLRPVIETLKQGKLTADELREGIDMKALLGAACLVEMEQTEREGKVFSNIKSISRVPKGTKVPPAVSDTKFFSLDPDEFDEEVLEGLHEKRQAKIKGTVEYARAIAPPPPPPGKRPSIHDELNDGIPFGD